MGFFYAHKIFFQKTEMRALCSQPVFSNFFSATLFEIFENGQK